MVDEVRDGLASDPQHHPQNLLFAIARRQESIDIGAGANLRLRAELARRFAWMEAGLGARLREARAAGELAPATDPAALVAVLAAVARGMVLRARSGTDRAELLAIAQTAIGLVPYSPLAA